ncbi:cupin domain-containing protein [Paenibacillus harenae]|uniref:cupin domain-containing protein n=1 Tax=Paenibacillus harenae TaxID=306543 RepID=UPI00041A677B|nr:cupin domain-containing protein [Paenibacillus harenae]
MIRIRLCELPLRVDQKNHVLGDLLPGAFLSSGGLAFAGRGDRSHTNDGPDGKDYHVHRDREAFIILQGNGTMEINGKHHPVEAGDIVIVEPEEDHHLCSSEQDPIITLWLHAGPNRHHNQT